jgi:hypothetical protein
MELGPSWEADSYPATRILRNPEVHYCVDHSPPCFDVLSQINPVHTHPSPNSISYGHSRLEFPQKPLTSAHLIRLHAVTQIKFSDKYKSRSSSLRNCLQSPITVSSLHSNISLRTLLSKTSSLWHFHKIRNRVSHPCKQQLPFSVFQCLYFLTTNDKTNASGRNSSRHLVSS